jgi:hypothetical protein
LSGQPLLAFLVQVEQKNNFGKLQQPLMGFGGYFGLFFKSWLV